MCVVPCNLSVTTREPEMRLRFTLLAASFVVGGAMAGCKKSGDASVARMTELKTKMCACKDKACIDQVSADMAKWSADHRSGGTDNASDDQKKLAAIAGETPAITVSFW